ncbi:purine and uridine phosphorylase [Aureobasidium sp. EXF-3400]|nr:purine and uridine phosphorylase [Aureobasidium sp. EXF-12344]KAI4771912.1 purine and uridine phosphorylase [Aureobasidium sp. EXF-3400]
MALTLEHIQIGWISALPIEALLAEIMLDEPIEQAIALPPNDNNIYTYGRIKIAGSHASHIVAIAQLPLSTTGRASAATVANNMRRTFPNLKFGIMVGIAGGVWTTEVDVRLGDIVVGVPDDGGPGIIQYDHGKAIQEREFILKGTLNKAPDLLRSAAGLLQRKHMRKPGEYVSLLDNEEVKRLAPRPDVDNLFSAAYLHHGGKSCEGCDKSQLRDRSHRTDLAPKVHYGAIASGDQVVKDAILAEKIQKRHNIMCFEMEAAGLDAFPCLVIRGISDYADTHKNDDWHAYAAGTAAAYAKELLSVVPLTAVAELPSTGFAEIARLQVPPLENTTPGDVTRWLATTKESWLLILDNCDDPELDFSNYIPSRGGSTIITTRLVECRIHGKWENIDELGSENAVQLLLKASGLEEGNQRIITPVAESIVSILGQHALALVHAGAYIKKGYCTLSDYVQFFRDEQNQLIEFKPEQQASRYGSVYTTFEVSAKALASSDKHDSHLALKLLNIIAFLDREGIEEDVFTTAFDKCHGLECQWEFVWQENEVQCEENNEANKNAAAHNKFDDDGEIHHLDIWHCNKVRSSGLVDFQKAMRLRAACIRLADLSLIKFDNNTISMHPLVHEWARTRLDEVVRQNAWEQALSVLALIFETLANSYELQPHTLASRSKLLLRAKAMCFGELGKLDKMRSCVDQVVQSTTQWFEWNSWEAFDAQRLLADLYHTAGDSQAAANLLESLYERYSQSNVLGDLVVRSLLHSLIWAHQSLGNSDRAITLLIEELKITKRLCSRYHPYLLNTLSRLSASYITANAAEKAVALLQDVVDPQFKQIPRDYWWVEIMLTLARAYSKTGAYDKAIPVLEEIHSHCSTSLSAKDPLRTAALNQLVEAYLKVGRSIQATTLLEKLVETCASSRIPSDPGRLISMDRLAKAYLDLDKPSQAVPLLEEVVRVEASNHPPNDRRRLISMDRLAHAYLRLNEPNQAVGLLKEVLEVYASALLPHDPGRLISMDRLAKAYLELDKPSEAVPLLEEVIKYLPENDSRRLISMDRLAEAHVRRGKPDSAIALLEDVVENLPTDDPRRLISMDRLANAYLKLDRCEQAVPLLEKLVALRTAHLAEQDISRLMSVRNLARAYTDLENSPRVHEALSLLEEVMDKGRETLHADPDQMKWTRELLVNAQEKLRSTSQRQSLMGINAEKCIPDNTADDTLSNMVYQNIQNPLKRGLASTDLDVNDDGNKQNNDEKRSRPTS